MLSLQNWAGNVDYSASAYHFPESVEEVQRLVERAEKVKALGSRHSFSQIANTRGELIALDKLNRILSLDPDAKTVTIESGVRYGELCRFLSMEGWALPNLASLPHISVAGACATATHGSGDQNGCLANSVVSLDLVTADGSLRTFRKGEAEFEGAVVHLGALGVVVKLTLALQPSCWRFSLRFRFTNTSSSIFRSPSYWRTLTVSLPPRTASACSLIGRARLLIRFG
jgi:alditol oxidase